MQGHQINWVDLFFFEAPSVSEANGKLNAVETAAKNISKDTLRDALVGTLFTNVNSVDSIVRKLPLPNPDPFNDDAIRDICHWEYPEKCDARFYFPG